jgi:hypothetical protein
MYVGARQHNKRLVAHANSSRNYTNLSPFRASLRDARIILQGQFARTSCPSFHLVKMLPKSIKEKYERNLFCC